MDVTPHLRKYTLEKLHESYERSIPQAMQVMEKFGSEKERIGRFMRRCDRRRRVESRGMRLHS